MWLKGADFFFSFSDLKTKQKHFTQPKKKQPHERIFKTEHAQNLRDAEVVWQTHLLMEFQLMICLPGLVKIIPRSCYTHLSSHFVIFSPFLELRSPT